MKNTVLFNIFFTLLFLFFWRSIVYWLNFSLGTANKDLLLYIFLAATMLVGVVLIGKYREQIPFRSIHIIAFAWFFLMVVIAVFNKTAISLSLKSLFWPIVFEVTFIYAKIGGNTEKFFRNYFFLLVIMGFFFMLYKLIRSDFGGASNLVYFSILPMPFLLLSNDKQKQYILFFVMAAMSILSAKRSMILAIAIFILIWGLYNTIKKKKVIQSIVLFIVMSSLVVYSFQNFDFLSKGRLAEKMSAEDVSNGREMIYDVTILMIQKSSTGHKILGNGHNAVCQDSPLEISAHNEWLEIMYDYGFIAIALYLCLWMFILSNWYRMFKTKSKYFIPYSLLICIWAVMSMVSQLLLYVSYVLYLFMFLAYVEGNRDKICYKINRNRKILIH